MIYDFIENFELDAFKLYEVWMLQTAIYYIIEDREKEEWDNRSTANAIAYYY